MGHEIVKFDDNRTSVNRDLEGATAHASGTNAANCNQDGHFVDFMDACIENEDFAHVLVKFFNGFQ